ncbi:MAG: hypothetical protein SNJ67_02375 [Chloracidobacterium sp.]|uniref:Uncharacterized protein n=1 Tax=Chloracidobacterium validum TaxID=2821543 RepID=A0ABX8BA53_9BACT|nr:hypothetical protein [Chloracidobacterium validum]QUW03817.1 hypothetical protein J8C06_05150 [Chloracidobacterium validum]
MTQRVNVLCIRTADGRIAPLAGQQLDIRRVFGNALPVFEREEVGMSFLARYVPPSSDEFFVTRYEAIGEVRQFAQRHNLKLWLDPQCDFNGQIIPESGIKGDPSQIASIVLKR